MFNSAHVEGHWIMGSPSLKQQSITYLTLIIICVASLLTIADTLAATVSVSRFRRDQFTAEAVLQVNI